eukprot:4142381-Prymnesium_polylepis.1
MRWWCAWHACARVRERVSERDGTRRAWTVGSVRTCTGPVRVSSMQYAFNAICNLVPVVTWFPAVPGCRVIVKAQAAPHRRRPRTADGDAGDAAR